jgi:hypothetical protein
LIFYVGHHGEQRRATLSTRPKWLSTMRITGPAGVTNLLKLKRFNPEQGIVLRTAGTHLISLDTSDFQNSASPKDFEAYLGEESLAGALASWRRGPVAGRKVREAYRRYAKSLVKVGSGPQALASQATARLGHRLEIVPSANPYALRPGEPLDVKIWYRGKPLTGALVTLGNLDRPKDEPLARQSGSDGAVSFPLPQKGRWMMNVVWSEKSSIPAADYVTSFSSLTFGVPERS